MYFNIDCLKILNIPCTSDYNICYIKASKDRTKICILTKEAITIWLTAVRHLELNRLNNRINIYFQSNQLISFFIRSTDSINSYGENHVIEWRYDSTKIALLVSTFPKNTKNKSFNFC